MEQWKDQGIVLAVRPHGEGGAVVSLLTEGQGRYSGYVHGAQSSRMRPVLEPGTQVEAEWRARISDNLGSFRLEGGHSAAALLLNEPLRLSALMAACALCDAALPEREGHPGLYHGLLALLDALEGEAWHAAYVVWEIALLKELGFGLDLSRCAAGGDRSALAWVSPKTGRAVSYAAGEPYKDKLLPLPDFLKPNGGPVDTESALTGLKLTGYFLGNWAFAHHNAGMPEARRRFQARLERDVGGAGIA